MILPLTWRSTRIGRSRQLLSSSRIASILLIVSVRPGRLVVHRRQGKIKYLQWWKWGARFGNSHRCRGLCCCLSVFVIFYYWLVAGASVVSCRSTRLDRSTLMTGDLTVQPLITELGSQKRWCTPVSPFGPKPPASLPKLAAWSDCGEL